MKRKGIIVFILALVLILVGIVVIDLNKTKTDKRPGNPYVLEYDNLKVVDPALISHKETKNFRLSGDSIGAITIDSSHIFVSVDKQILVLDFNGTLQHTIAVKEVVYAMALTEDQNLFVAHTDMLERIDKQGNILAQTKLTNEKALITNMACFNQRILVADAGNRQVHEYNGSLQLIQSFEGKREEGALHGFIVPSASFDLDFTNSGELWVVNPGLHAIEQYDDGGKMRAFWEATSFKLDGFSGCCNPSRICIMPDDAFVTSEKGIVRIKIHAPSGEFRSVVAPPSVFKENGKAPDIEVDENGVVYALDYDNKMIRVFEPIK